MITSKFMGWAGAMFIAMAVLTVACKSPNGDSEVSPLATAAVSTAAGTAAVSTAAGTPAELTQDEATSRAVAACNALAQAGVAQNCRPQIGGPLRDRVGWGIAHFNIVGAFPNDEGQLLCFRNDAEYQKRDISPDHPPDDYPNLTASSPKTRLSITVTTTDLNNDKWDDCMDKKNSVPACAKVYPKQYAAFHAWYDAAKRVVGDVGR